MKVSELTGAALDWAVAKCEGWEPGKYMMSPDIRKDVNVKVIGIMVPSNRKYVWFKPSTDWAQSGPIIEREEIELKVLANCLNTDNHPTFKAGDAWEANLWPADRDLIEYCGLTPLIAAMRCYVASKLGDDIEVPRELK